MTVNEILKIIDKRSPFESALDWDNVGLLIGDGSKEVTNIYMALDATDAVIDRAIGKGAELLITHHPLLFSAIKNIRADDFIGKRIIKLVENGISYIAMHTNYDIYGMADAVAEMLELVDCVPLEESSEGEGIGRIGTPHEECTLIDYSGYVKERFELSHVRYYGDESKRLKKIAVCPGSGKSDIDIAVAKGADVLVTGDIDHHSGIDAVEKGIAIIDAGHFGLEQMFVYDEKDYLDAELSGTGIRIFTEYFNEPLKVLV